MKALTVASDQKVLSSYAELHCCSNFSFLRGASHPEELVIQAQALGYTALALTDECTLAGVVRAHLAARDIGFKLIIGSEFKLTDGPRLVLLATDRDAYGNLSELITQARRAAKKGSYQATRPDVEKYAEGCLALWLPSGDDPERDFAEGQWMARLFPGRAWIAVEFVLDGRDQARFASLTDLGRQLNLPLVAAGDVHMHARSRRPLQDVLTAIRLGTTVEAAVPALHPNGERCLRASKALAKLYPPELLVETARIAERCHFSLDELRYEYPEELVPAGETPVSHLHKLTEAGMRQRWPSGAPPKVRNLVEHELALIAELQYEPYFLTVHDVVHFARARGILCQGRGSAANSAVCFCLGITEVDPARIDTLFERFVSKERNEPPDIDVDFEHERREEVIQYLYSRYGRERAALAATVITYRPKSAVRDVGKVLGFSLEQVDSLASNLAWWDGGGIAPARLIETGFDPRNSKVRLLLQLVHTLIGFPRHLSQHVGGFVIARDKLSRLVPIENAAMPDRTVIEWDKDDLDALGLLKVDVLGLGMLTAIRKSFDLVREFRGRELTMASIPPEDPEVYRMIQQADTTGVFQIESRAQMAMLPRLKPACFYDLVIEVAIMRPGPIQGDMVHPYLQRRQGLEPVSYPSEAVREVLERTLGVPIFQEQVIKLAMVAAGFTPGEADRLRRSMAAFRRRGGIEQFEARLIDGMRARGYSETFAKQIFKQIEGFGEYGFPECIVGETRVVDADTGRWRTIEDILSGTTPLKHTLACDDDLRLRKRKVLAITRSGMKPVFCLRTTLGYTIMATAEHPFFTVSGWHELKQLRAGDYIAAARSLPLAGRRRWPRHRIIVLADLIAEGNLCHPSTLYFYTTDTRHRDEFARAVEHFPNTRAVLERHRDRFSVRVRRVHQRRLSGAVMWAQRLGIWGCNAREKFLPPEVFELRDSDIALLLARLWEGDGSFSQARHASYNTASRRLAKDVQHLLLRLGIVARLYCRARSYRNRRIEHFTVTVTGRELLQQFYRRIARRFLNPEKCRQVRTLATQGVGGRMSRDIIPAAVREIIRRERDALGLTWEEIGRRTGLSIREIQSRGKHKKGFRRFVIGRLATCLRSRELARLANADLYWDRIVSIEPVGRRETYDLQIEGNHNFLANNLVVHNSHSASFALLVYVSAWLKRYEPQAFLCALLNSQPMGFYAPSQLVQDGRRHGIEVRPADVRYSCWDSSLERGTGGKSAVRLGLHLVKGLTHMGVERLLQARRRSPFTSVEDLAQRAGLNARDLDALANADALADLSGHRHRAHWSVAGVEPPLPLLASTTVSEALPMLRSPTEGENIVADYASLGLTLRRHPLALLRTALTQRRILAAAKVRAIPHGEAVHTAGLVISRQHPSSGNGVVFVTLEDETGQTNLIIWPSLVTRQRRELLNASLLGVVGKVQREGEVQHVIARQLEDYSVLLGDLVTRSRDFR